MEHRFSNTAMVTIVIKEVGFFKVLIMRHALCEIVSPFIWNRQGLCTRSTSTRVHLLTWLRSRPRVPSTGWTRAVPCGFDDFAVCVTGPSFERALDVVEETSTQVCVFHIGHAWVVSSRDVKVRHWILNIIRTTIPSRVSVP